MIRRILHSPKLHFLVGGLFIVVGVGLFSLQTIHSNITAFAGSDYYPPSSFNGVSITTNCSTDDTIPLNGWVATVPNGSTIEFPSGDCYDIEGSIAIANRQNLTLDGNSSVNLGPSANMLTTEVGFNGAKFLAQTDGRGTTPPTGIGNDTNGALWPRDRSQFIIYDSSGITLENMRIHGSANINPNGEGLSNTATGCSENSEVFTPPDRCTYEGQYGVVFRGSSGTLTNDVITDTNSDLVGITGSNLGNPNPTPSSYVTINGSYMSGANRDGPSIYDGNNVTINNNYESNNDPLSVVFDTEPVAARWQNNYITFTNNTIGPHGGEFISGAGSSTVNDNIVVENNVITTGGGDMQFGQGLSTNGNVSSITNPPIRQNLTIENNTGPETPSDTRGAITVSGFNNVIISGNSATINTKNSPSPVFLLNLVTNTTIENNSYTVSGSKPLTLLKIVDSKSPLASSNNIFCNNKTSGVVVDGSCSSPVPTPPPTQHPTPTTSQGQGGGQNSTTNNSSSNTKNSQSSNSTSTTASNKSGQAQGSSSTTTSTNTAASDSSENQNSPLAIPLIHIRLARQDTSAIAYGCIMIGVCAISFAIIHRKLFWI